MTLAICDPAVSDKESNHSYFYLMSPSNIICKSYGRW